jgi:hypothetical protein
LRFAGGSWVTSHDPDRFEATETEVFELVLLGLLLVGLIAGDALRDLWGWVRGRRAGR